MTYKRLMLLMLSGLWLLMGCKDGKPGDIIKDPNDITIRTAIQYEIPITLESSESFQSTKELRQHRLVSTLQNDTIVIEAAELNFEVDYTNKTDAPHTLVKAGFLFTGTLADSTLFTYRTTSEALQAFVCNANESTRIGLSINWEPSETLLPLDSFYDHRFLATPYLVFDEGAEFYDYANASLLGNWDIIEHSLSSDQLEIVFENSPDYQSDFIEQIAPSDVDNHSKVEILKQGIKSTADNVRLRSIYWMGVLNLKGGIYSLISRQKEAESLEEKTAICEALEKLGEPCEGNVLN